MKHKFISKAISSLLAAAIAGTISVPAALAQHENDKIADILKDRNTPYDVILHFESDDSSLSRKEKAQSAQAEAKNIIAENAGGILEWQSYYITNAIHVKTNSKDLLTSLASLPEVDEVTWNGRVERVEPIEDDEEKAELFSASIFMPDERDIEWGVEMVHADKVWDEFGIDGTGARVGIIDGGANYNLPALKRAYLDYDETTGSIIEKEDDESTETWEGGAYRDFVNGTDTPQKTSSDDHGTHVAGTIVGAEGENLNRIGVAPGAKFITARAMDEEGGDVNDLIAAAEWMLEMHPDVVNNSWGGAADNDTWFMDVVDAWNEAGIIPVFAAGNTAGEVPGAGTISNPANYPNVLAVAAVDRDKQIGRFSNKGPSAFDSAGTKPEISAPGVQVRSVDSGGTYVSWNGTSMAAPHVTGVVALVRAAARKAGREADFDTLDEIRALLQDTAEPLTDDIYNDYPNIAYGYGLVNAYDAVARIMGRDTVEFKGTVLQDGEDTENPALSFDGKLIEGYLGRDIRVNVNISDDVSIRSASLTYTVQGREPKTEKLTLASGAQNDGLYYFIIPGSSLTKGTLKLEASATDYGSHTVTIKKEIEIKPGMKPPYKQDFEDAENGLPGFLMDGIWSLSDRENNAEPEFPEGLDGNENHIYVATNGGYAGFSRRIDSNLYLPPIDLSEVTAGDKPSLSVDMYNGFTGISLAKVQVSETGAEDSWEDLYHVILRPDITERQWQHCTFSLEKYAGLTAPLQIRFYFFGHDADDGAGWYLDNMQVLTHETAPPSKVEAIHGTIGSKGLCVSFDANEETDLAGYEIERKTDSGEFEKIGDIKQNPDAFQFVNRGEEETRPFSHYHVNYYDKTADGGHSYTYRVCAYDFTGNKGEYSTELEIEYKSEYINTVLYDFDESDDGFTSDKITGDLNEWQWGKPERPESVDMERLFNIYAWGGLQKNNTSFWGTNLSAKPTAQQDSYLLMPPVTVGRGDYLYFDSYCGMKSLSSNVGFTVEIKENDSDLWLPLVSREVVMNDDQTFTWWQIGTSLEEYEGQTVDIRFHSVIDYGWLDAYNLGWYIDNVCVGGEERKFYSDDAYAAFSSMADITAASVDKKGMSLLPTDEYGNNDQKATGGNAVLLGTDGTTDGTPGIPFRALVTVEGSGRYTHSSEIDGTYAVKQAASSGNEYTLTFSAYGYKTEQINVKRENGASVINVPTVYMEKAEKTKLSGTVTGSDGTALADVNIRLIEDDNVPVLTTDKNGAYSGSAYKGKYTARFYKDGYRSVVKEIELTENGTNIIEPVILEKLGAMKSEKTDYGFVEETDNDGNYQTIQFTSGPHGVAVRFQSPHKGGILKSADIFLVQNQYYSGDHIMIGVIGYNETGRLVEVAPFREYDGLTANEWNTIDLSEFTVETDKPIYVAATYEKYGFNECMGVYYDTDATEKAIEKSYIYDGAFTAAKTATPAGAYALKANWIYPENAELNPESDESSGAGGGDIKIVDDITAFVFDKATQTITGYNGKGGDVTIPSEIDGTAVRHIGESAFDGTGKDTEIKLTGIVVPEGVETIGADAFKTNRLTNIKLPSTLKSIGARAFQYNYGENMDIVIPDGIKTIEEAAFRSVGSPLKITANGVTLIKKDAFDGIREIEVYADSLIEIEDEAFGTRYTSDFPYAKVYTAEDTTLLSVKNQHLINPAKVVVNEINARDHEDNLGRSTLYGENNNSIGRNMDIDRFYRIGDKTAVAPPDFRKNGIIYSSADKAEEITLKKDNAVTYYYYTLEPHVRLPILDSDTELMGFTLPNADVEVTAGKNTYTAKANEDGYFKTDISVQAAGTEVRVRINGKSALSQTVIADNNEDYIIDGTIIKRYKGSGGSLTLPTAVDGSGSVTEIADFAFYGSDLTSVVLPDTVKSIGMGAFMDTGLSSYGWNLKNINTAALVYINEYAFRGNKLTSVTMPELTHVIRTGAFENNEIETVQLGKYTAHIGDRAFKSNKIKALELADRAEEIGREVFMDNEIESLLVKPWMEGYDDGLSEIPERAFANNRLGSVYLPNVITYVDPSAFENNTESTVRFVIASDACEILPTEGYDVMRTSGVILHQQQTFAEVLGVFSDAMQIEITDAKDGGTALIVKTDSELPELTVYAASYGAGGALAGISSYELKDDIDGRSAVIPAMSGEFKIFVWATDENEPMRPVIIPIAVNIAD